MYLIGKTTRDDWWEDGPMAEAGLINKITKDHLAKARDDEDYNVINLITREYYNPKQNSWVKFEVFK
jgi:hypothetical protein